MENFEPAYVRHVRFGLKADICSAKRHVRFAPKSGRPVLANRVLPVLDIKMMRLQCREINIIDAARVNVDFVRIRSWHIERMGCRSACRTCALPRQCYMCRSLDRLGQTITRTAVAVRSDG